MATLKVALLGLCRQTGRFRVLLSYFVAKTWKNKHFFATRDPTTAPRKGFAAPSSTTRLPIKRLHARRSAAELPGAGPAHGPEAAGPSHGAGHPPAAGDLPARHVADRPERRMGRLRGLAPTIVALDNPGRYPRHTPQPAPLAWAWTSAGPR